MMLQITIGHHVVVSLGSVSNLFSSDTIFFGRLWSLARRLEVVLIHVNIADDIVVTDCVFSWTEIPGLFFWVVWAIL